MALCLTQQTWAQEHKLTPWLLAAHGLLLQIKTKISETPTDSQCSDGGPQAPEKAQVYLALQPCCHFGNEYWSHWLMSMARFTEESAVAVMLLLSRLFLCRPPRCSVTSKPTLLLVLCTQLGRNLFWTRTQIPEQNQLLFVIWKFWKVFFYPAYEIINGDKKSDWSW